MADSILDNVLKASEEEGKAKADAFEKETNGELAEIQGQYLLSRQKKREDLEYECLEATQHSAAAHLRGIRDKIYEASRRYAKDNLMHSDEKIEVSYLWARPADGDDRTILMITPIGTESPDNSARYLSDRIKAITLETLLEAKASQGTNPIQIVKHCKTHDLMIFDISYQNNLRNQNKGSVLE